MSFKETSLTKFHSNQNLSFYIQKNSKKNYFQKTKIFQKKFSHKKNGKKKYFKKYNTYDYNKENDINYVNNYNNYKKNKNEEFDEYYFIKNNDFNEFNYKNEKRAKKKISIDDNSTFYHSNSNSNELEINENNILNENEKIEIFENKEIPKKENLNNQNLNFDNLNNKNKITNLNHQNKFTLNLFNIYNNKYFENTEILNINIKISKDKIVEFKLRRFDDLFFTVKLFCEINKIDEKFIKPFIIKILEALNNIFKIMNYNCGKIDINQIDNIKSKL